MRVREAFMTLNANLPETTWRQFIRRQAAQAVAPGFGSFYELSGGRRRPARRHELGCSVFAVC